MNAKHTPAGMRSRQTALYLSSSEPETGATSLTAPNDIAREWMRGPGRFSRITDRAELMAELDRFIMRRMGRVLRKAQVLEIVAKVAQLTGGVPMTPLTSPLPRPHAPALCVLTEARRLLAAGLSVLPIAADGTKAPASSVASWKEFQTRRMTAEEVGPMFRGNVGLAIISGAVSGHLECLDFDEPGLYAQFEAVAEDNGMSELLCRLPLVETPTGGAHLRYRCAAPVEGNQKLARQTFAIPEGVPVEGKGNARYAQIGKKKYPVVTVNGEDRALKCVIETRGEGGYALAPPSPAACHEAKRPYVLRRGDLAAIPVLSPAEVQTLHNLARIFHQYEEPAPVATSPRREQSERIEGTRPGEDFDNRGLSVALELLQAAGWKARTHGEGWHLTRPGKSKGTSATLNIIPNCLHVFSPNAAPFEDGGTYSPFAVFARLKHNGDFSEAARELAAQDYGTPHERPAHCGRR